MTARPSALFLAPEAPYPIAGGGSLRSASLLEYLGRHYDVDVIVFRQPGALDPASLIPLRLVRRVTVLELPPNRRGFAARALRNAGRVVRRTPPLVDRFAGFSAQIARALSGARYDLGVIEHSWCAPYLEQVSPVCTRTVLDLHNVESVLHGRCAEAEGRATATAHRVFQRASRELERAWLPRFSLVLTTSQADAALARAMAPQARVAVYPNALPPTPLPAAGDEEAIVFSGNMEYHPNLTAVRFFRREVWPRLPGRGRAIHRRRPADRSRRPRRGRRVRTRALARRGGTLTDGQRHSSEDSGGLGGRIAGGIHHDWRGRPAGP